MLNDVKKMIQEELPKGETILPDEQLEEACEMSEDMEMLTSTNAIFIYIQRHAMHAHL